MNAIRFICAEPWCEQQVVVSAIDHDKLVAELEAAEAGISTVVAHTAAEVAALRLQLSRARELLEQCKDKLALYRNEHSGEYVGGVEYTALVRGLTEFLKEVGEE